MSKRKEKETPKPVVKEKKDDRKERYAELLKRYEARNPKKFASKKKNGEYKDIPKTFK